MADDMNPPSWDRFQEAQRKLNLVKTHAHEIVGVKREQVSMVVENFSRPGTYDITVHDSGRVYTTQWTPPAFDEAFVEVTVPQEITPEIEVAEPEEELSEPVEEVISDVISESPHDRGLAEEVAVYGEIPDPETAAAA